ncbi:hypothetical protein Tco_1451322, partial [Tanacetum coccineum]
LFPSDMSLGKILGKILPPWHQFLDQKIRGAHFSLGIVVGERFAIELTPSTFHQRHFAGDRFPQRHVAGEKVGMLLGKHRMLYLLLVYYLFIGLHASYDTSKDVSIGLLVRRYYATGSVQDRDKPILLLCSIISSAIGLSKLWSLDVKFWVWYAIMGGAWFLATLGLRLMVKQARKPKLWGVSLVSWLPSARWRDNLR